MSSTASTTHASSGGNGTNSSAEAVQAGRTAVASMQRSMRATQDTLAALVAVVQTLTTTTTTEMQELKAEVRAMGSTLAAHTKSMATKDEVKALLNGLATTNEVREIQDEVKTLSSKTSERQKRSRDMASTVVEATNDTAKHLKSIIAKFEAVEATLDSHHELLASIKALPPPIPLNGAQIRDAALARTESKAGAIPSDLEKSLRDLKSSIGKLPSYQEVKDAVNSGNKDTLKEIKNVGFQSSSHENSLKKVVNLAHDIKSRLCVAPPPGFGSQTSISSSVPSIAPTPRSKSPVQLHDKHVQTISNLSDNVDNMEKMLFAMDAKLDRLEAQDIARQAEAAEAAVPRETWSQGKIFKHGGGGDYERSNQALVQLKQTSDEMRTMRSRIDVLENSQDAIRQVGLIEAHTRETQEVVDNLWQLLSVTEEW